MKSVIYLILISALVTSCATKLNSKTNKAIYRSSTDEIIWKQKRYTIDWLTLQYDAKAMFLDDRKTQKAIMQANEMSTRSLQYLWGGLGLAILYLYTNTIDNENERKLIYYSIFTGVGLIPYLYVHSKRSDMLKNEIDHYNQRNGYVTRFNTIPIGLKYSSKF